MLGNTRSYGMPFVLLNNFFQMRLLRLIVHLVTRPIKKLLAIAQLPSESGLISFPEAKWRKQKRLLQSGTWRVLPIKIKCLREFYLLLLKGFSTEFLLSYRKKNLRNKTVEFIDAVRRSMGVHCVVLEGYKATGGVKVL